MRLTALLLFALAAPALAQATDPMRPTPARWDIQVRNGNRYLRATSDNGEGPGKLMFLCNETGQLVLMAMAMGAGSDGIAEATGSVGIVLDGAVEAAAEQPRPIVMNQSLVSLLAMDPARFRRLMAAEAAGVVWNGRDGNRLAGFQVGLGDGRARLASFARECSAQNYP